VLLDMSISYCIMLPAMPVVAIAIGGVLAVVTLAILVTTVVWARHYCHNKNRVDDAGSDTILPYMTPMAGNSRYWRVNRGLARHTSWQTSPYDYVNKKLSSKTNVVSCSLLVDIFDTT